MGDTKEGREKQARHAEKRQRRREVAEARERGDEPEPPEDSEEPRTCHLRGCTELAAFHVVERYQEDTGHGAVTATADVCPAHAEEESPTNVDKAYADYEFRVTPLLGAFDSQGE